MAKKSFNLFFNYSLFIFSFLIFLSFAYANPLAVELVDISPYDFGKSIIPSENVTFTCKASGDSLFMLALFTDISGSWQVTKSISNPSNNTNTDFSVSRVQDGIYNWSCRATSASGELTAPPWRIKINSRNDAPIITSVSLSPSPAYATTSLTASVSAYDPDGDSFTYSYQWKKNGVVISGANSNTLSSSNFRKSDSIVLEVAASDSILTGSTVSSASLTISNSPPKFSGTITNQEWTKDDSISFAVNSYFSDADGDSLVYSMSGNSDIKLTLSGGDVEATADDGWFGEETVIFSASDGSTAVQSNSVTLTVLEATTESDSNETATTTTTTTETTTTTTTIRLLSSVSTTTLLQAKNSTENSTSSITGFAVEGVSYSSWWFFAIIFVVIFLIIKKKRQNLKGDIRLMESAERRGDPHSEARGSQAVRSDTFSGAARGSQTDEVRYVNRGRTSPSSLDEELRNAVKSPQPSEVRQVSQAGESHKIAFGHTLNLASREPEARRIDASQFIKKPLIEKKPLEEAVLQKQDIRTSQVPDSVKMLFPMITFIEQNIKKYDENKLKTALISRGWTPEQVAEGFNIFRARRR